MAKTPEDIIRDLLLANSTISDALVTRIYPQFAPQTAPLPYAITNRLAEDHQKHMEAASGLVSISVQVDFYSETIVEVRALGDAAREALDGFSGVIAETTVHSIHLESGFDAIDTPEDANDEPIRRTIQTYEVWLNESVPTFSP